MTRQPKITAYIDSAGEHRERISAANGEPLYVTSEGYEREEDMLIAGELVRRAKNEQYYGDAAYRARVDALMARRDAASAQYPYGALVRAMTPIPVGPVLGELEKGNRLLGLGKPKPSALASLLGGLPKQDW
jgi:uncharacterized protein YegP (UPF0339 family)